MNYENKCFFKKMLTLIILLKPIFFTAYAWVNDHDLSYFSMERLLELEEELGLDMNFKMSKIEASDLRALFATYPLDGPLWKSTRAPSGRDPLYLLPQKIIAIEYGGVAISFFYNQTNRMPMTVSTLFGDLFDPPGAGGEPRGFIPLLQTSIEGFIADSESSVNPEQVSRDVVTLLPFLRNLTTQQRQAGFFVQAGFAMGPLMLQVHTPFLISERNFWLGARDRRLVEELMKNYATSAADFDYSELFHIRYGLGDTRLKLGLNMVNMTNFALDFGGEAILPTSLLSYDPRFQTHSEQVVEATPIAIDDFVTNMTDVLRGIRDYWLDPRLGNNGHWGAGIYLETKFGLFHDFFQLWTRVSYDLLMRGKEDRLFMFVPTLTSESLDSIPPSDNRNQAEADLVNAYLKQYVLPSAFRCTIRPGGVFNAVAVGTVNWGRWRFSLGYDYYAKQKEHLHRLHDTNVKISDLAVEAGLVERVQQHKIFSESLYSWTSKKAQYSFGYGSDFTLANENIGSDWTVYLKFVASF